METGQLEREHGADLAAAGQQQVPQDAAERTLRLNTTRRQIGRLGADIAAILREPAMQEAVRAAYLEPVALDAGGTADALAAYRKQWEPVVRESGFKAEQ